MSGYVRLHRSLLGHPAFRNDAEAMAFAWMIAKASYAPTCQRYKERKLELQRGQLAISQRDMARALDRDKAWVERLWRRLRAEAMIEADVKAGVAVITICNYDEYQAGFNKDEADVRQSVRQGQGRGEAQNKEGNKGKKESTNKDSPRARKSRLPENFEPTPFKAGTKCAKLVAGWSPEFVEHLVEEFKAYHTANGSFMDDWTAAWRTWVLKADTYGTFTKWSKRHGTGSEHPGGKTGAAAASLLDELEAREARRADQGAVLALPSRSGFAD